MEKYVITAIKNLCYTENMTKKIKKFFVKNKKKIILSTSIIAIVAIIVAVFCVIMLPSINNDIRKDRIISIFNSLKLDDQKYIFHGEYVRGESMTLNWVINKNSVYSRSYTRNANVDTTVSEVRKAATSAGLIYVGEPYPNMIASHLFDYRTTRNEYIRIAISSKLRDDAFFNNPNMTQAEMIALDSEVNSAPTNVMIDVNLDGIN
jgi:hypothetical protein